LPFYGRLRTTLDFKAMAKNFALMRKAIVEVRKAEDFLLSGQVTEAQYKQSLRDIVDFTGIAASEADSALAIVKAMKKRVSKYQRELVDAVG